LPHGKPPGIGDRIIEMELFVSRDVIGAGLRGARRAADLGG